jgi:seryl-tRNA synthetase
VINWGHVARAIAFYEARGYHYREMPWIVSPEAVQVTLPEGHEAMQCSRGLPTPGHRAVPFLAHEPMLCQVGSLVGSAEQSFIQQAVVENQDLDGRYMAATPCFRDDVIDAIHQRTFFKVELIEIHRSSDRDWVSSALHRMLDDALAFFRALPLGVDACSIETPEGFDITLEGVELGSFGVREHRGWTWCYGTGFADPRFSLVTSGALSSG